VTKTVGRITTMHRYPVKSMGGERLSEAPVTLQGVAGDRGFAFVQTESKSPFPWLTGREAAAMLNYSAAMTADSQGVEVTTPGGAILPADSDDLLSELAGLADRPLSRLSNYRGSFDVAPVTLMAHATVKAIAEASEIDEDHLRFRMNFYIDTGDDTPFVENDWVGRVVRIGDTVRVAVTEPDKRCVMITLDHGTGGGESPKVLRATAEMNDACAGVYGAVFTAGAVREGDAVTLE
jgi:MOSC domain-containing protein